MSYKGVHETLIIQSIRHQVCPSDPYCMITSKSCLQPNLCTGAEVIEELQLMGEFVLLIMWLLYRKSTCHMWANLLTYIEYIWQLKEVDNAHISVKSEQSEGYTYLCQFITRSGFLLMVTNLFIYLFSFILTGKHTLLVKMYKSTQ